MMQNLFIKSLLISWNFSRQFFGPKKVVKFSILCFLFMKMIVSNYLIALMYRYTVEVETRASSQLPTKVKFAISAILAKSGKIVAIFANTICLQYTIDEWVQFSKKLSNYVLRKRPENVWISGPTFENPFYKLRSERDINKKVNF